MIMGPNEESYRNGEFKLVEWEDVNYCEHYFAQGDDGLSDKEVVDLLQQLTEENRHYKILTDELIRQNKKLKARLNDLGVEYYD